MVQLIRSLVFVFLLASPSLSFQATVTKVKDGDTADLIASEKFTCRLYGIDAPETAKRGKRGQPYGVEAQDNLTRLIGGKTVDVELTGAKTYNREVCRIYRNGEDINLRMVRDGYAWAYVQYLKRPHASEFIGAEEEARREKRGLWHDYNPTPPWEFRKLQKHRR
jgi:endonuclease YncB( thermonuclease family)